jgi:hypothetical protein
MQCHNLPIDNATVVTLGSRRAHGENSYLCEFVPSNSQFQENLMVFDQISIL